MSQLHYVEDSTFIQVKPPQWSKHFAGDVDSCSVVYQGAQYRAKAFMDALTKYATLVCTDEAGANLNDAGMFLITWSSDESPVLPSVTLSYLGLRGGAATDAMPEDDITIQTASTSKEITDVNSVNYQKTITLSLTYRAARTTYKWTTLSNPGTTPTYTTVRKQLSIYMGSPNILSAKFSGMVDDAGDPTNTIPLGDATAVWNTFTQRTQTSSFTVSELVPGHVYSCQTVNDYIVEGV